MKLFGTITLYYAIYIQKTIYLLTYYLKLD